MYIYRTYFKLVEPVIDLNEAREYLTEDDMVQYLKGDDRQDPNTTKDVTKITWILQDEQSGYIELEATRELEDYELSKISDWVSGQNSDGLGEGFEQQDFACYDIDEDGYPIDSNRMWDYEGETETVMASFDWHSNQYKFELYKKD